MAYTRRPRRARSVARRPNRTSSRRRVTSSQRGRAQRSVRGRSSGRTQTIRLVVETAPVSAAQRPDFGIGVKPAPAPHKAKF